VRRSLLTSVIVSTLVCVGMLGLALGFGWSPRLGLDLRGGLSVTYKPARKVTNATLQTVVNIMSARANALGVAQPSITTQGTDVVVQLPGVKNANQVLNTIGTTAQLYFRPVLCGAPAFVAPKTKSGTAVPVHYTTPPTCPASYQYTSAYFSAASSGYSVPPSIAEYPAYASYETTSSSYDQAHPHENVILSTNGQGQAARYVLGPEIASGKIIKSATAQLSTSGTWAVDFNLTGPGSTIFNNLASKYYGRLVADDLDGQVISAPVIASTSFPGSGQVSGSFTSQSANALALQLNYGSFPVRMVALTSQTVSASLGSASLRAGLLAGALGLLLVMAYTIVYYRALGIVVVLGLATTGAFLYGLISALGASSLGLTLDLSGVTGLIVSVGITVDSYIVYFERLKDEVRAGRSIRASVDKGFKSAYRTILSADAVSFLGALVLWLLSVGAVKGFAFMLGISTLTDVATAYVFTRPLVILLGRNRMFTEARWLGIARGLAQTVEPAT
jgi:preprotein translocase subunit SecD